MKCCWIVIETTLKLLDKKRKISVVIIIKLLNNNLSNLQSFDISSTCFTNSVIEYIMVYN